jgi:hypothetical protein
MTKNMCEDPLRPIKPLEIHGQCMTMVLAALYDFGSCMSKQATIDYVHTRGWFNLEPEDRDPFPSQTEQKWRTMLAYARKDCADRDLLDKGAGRDIWQLTRKGRECFEKVRNGLQDGQSVRRGFLWSPKFKKWLCSGYEPSDADVKRPSNYRDALFNEYV